MTQDSLLIHIVAWPLRLEAECPADPHGGRSSADGDLGQGFSIVTPWLWNTLPRETHPAMTLTHFKMELFRQSFVIASCDYDFFSIKFMSLLLS